MCRWQRTLRVFLVSKGQLVSEAIISLQVQGHMVQLIHSKEGQSLKYLFTYLFFLADRIAIKTQMIISGWYHD